MAGTPMPTDGADHGERQAAGNHVQIAVPVAGSAFEYQPGSPAMIYAMPHQLPSAPPSDAAVAAYPGLDDDDDAPLLANPALEAKMDKKLRRKMKKWLKRLEDSGKNYHESNTPFKQAPLQEKLPFYLSVATLVCSFLQCIYLSAIAFPRHGFVATSATLGVQLFLLLGVYIAQAVLSRKLRFTKGLVVVTAIALGLSILLGTLAISLNGFRAIAGGFDWVLVGCVLQGLWLHTIRANKKSSECKTASPVAPVAAV